MGILAGLLVSVGCSTKKINNKRAMFLYQDGIKLAADGNFDKAMDKFNQSIAISEENGFNSGVAHNYNEIGNVYTYKQKYDIARSYFENALAIYKEQNMAPEISKCIDNIAKTYLRQGDFPNTLKQYERLVAWDFESGNMLGAGITNYNMALICEKYIRAYNKAGDYFQAALDIFIQIKREKEAQQARDGLKRVEGLTDSI